MARHFDPDFQVVKDSPLYRLGQGEDRNDSYEIFTPEYFSGTGYWPCRLEYVFVLARGPLGFTDSGQEQSTGSGC